MSEEKVEAILFAAGKEISKEKIAQLADVPLEEVDTALQNLQQYYDQADRSFYLTERPLGWKLAVKDEHISTVSSLVPMTEVDRPLMETLAVIAWRYPVVQSEIVKLRGPSAYEHMRQLMEMGFVAKERSGRTYKVKLTKKFFHYFDLPSEKAKKAFLEQIPKELIDEAEAVDKETDEVERLVELEKQEEQAKNEIEKAMQQAQE